MWLKLRSEMVQYPQETWISLGSKLKSNKRDKINQVRWNDLSLKDYLAIWLLAFYAWHCSCLKVLTSHVFEKIVSMTFGWQIPRFHKSCFFNILLLSHLEFTKQIVDSYKYYWMIYLNVHKASCQQCHVKILHYGKTIQNTMTQLNFTAPFYIFRFVSLLIFKLAGRCKQCITVCA